MSSERELRKAVELLYGEEDGFHLTRSSFGCGQSASQSTLAQEDDTEGASSRSSNASRQSATDSSTMQLDESEISFQTGTLLEMPFCECPVYCTPKFSAKTAYFDQDQDLLLALKAPTFPNRRPKLIYLTDARHVAYVATPNYLERTEVPTKYGYE